MVQLDFGQSRATPDEYNEHDEHDEHDKYEGATKGHIFTTSISAFQGRRTEGTFCP